MNKTISIDVITKRRKGDWIEHQKALEQRTQDDFQRPQLIGTTGDIPDNCGPWKPPLTAERSECVSGDTFDNRIMVDGADAWGIASNLHGNAWNVDLALPFPGVNFSAVSNGRGYWREKSTQDGGTFSDASITADQFTGTFPVELSMRWRTTAENGNNGLILTQAILGPIQIDAQFIPHSPPPGDQQQQIFYRAGMSDGFNSVSVDSHVLASWRRQYLNVKVIATAPDTVGVKLWNDGQVEPDYIFATDAGVAMDPTSANLIRVSTVRPEVDENADFFYLDYILILDGYACELLPDWWGLFLGGLLIGDFDPLGNMSAETPVGNEQIVRAAIPEIGNTNTYRLPTKAEYVTDVWLDGLHTKPEIDWTFVPPATIEVIPPIPNGIEVTAQFVTNVIL